MRIRPALAFVMIIALISWIYSEYAPDTLAALMGQEIPSVRYEPSSPEIVDEMLGIAEVCRNDIVYDLGCGDGRIVIAAAKKCGARGVGIDKDPERIRESIRNADMEGVSCVKFLVDDLYSCSIRDATVVMLYLLPEANIALRPRLFQELSPGVRIVSHSHTMGRWRPDKKSAAGGHRIFFWVMPANVSGKWTWKYGGEEWALTLNQEFQDLKGTVRAGNTILAPESMTIDGDNISLSVSVPAGKIPGSIQFTGIVSGDRIEGWGRGAVSSRRGCEWRAERDPATVRSIY
ncbi:MAG: class I SAM-dependent methyltransferase [Syntrophales bacterium]|mgnify:CR=1 FL=1|nr:class I SAM-dependent methyltransferase [Syntrophales bacterium]MDD5533251.1 class I SAM-dependent methyltransferase [Syntrophales bacterium]HPL64384.1 class I SAM-dependent methyltransferase [Syntrophales bacterium]